MATPSESNPEATSSPTLDAFVSAAKAAGEEGEVRVKIDGGKYLVLATGKTASGHDVAWIANSEPDAISIYLSAFQKHFGQRLSSAVLEHFATELTPGKPLAARTVTLALEMADRCLTALSGVDFLTKLHSSAVAHGRNFEDACHQLGIAASSFSAESRKRIDSEIQQRFQAALMNGQSPVDVDRLQQWLNEAIRAEMK